MANSKQIRIVLIGCTGAGKSSLGNTLLGEDHFLESAAAKSVTSKCEIGEKLVGTRNIKVADTPGLGNADVKNLASVLEDFFDFLAPGPHAIIIVLSPNRETSMERRALAGLHEFFGDDNFLNYTMLVMVRKNDIIGEFGEAENIHDFIEQKSAENVQQLYAACHKRIVVVENKQKMTERQKEAEMVFAEIGKMDGFYCHRYFQLLANVKKKDTLIATKDDQITTLQQTIKQFETKKLLEEEIDELDKKREEKLRNRNESKCSIV